MSKLRKLARGRDCEIRIPGVCNGDPATTVLCHLPGGGMGYKRSDLAAAIGCSDCHAICDGRVRTNYKKDLIDKWFLEAVVRTIEIWEKEGHIRV